jgi:hypothetical protein
MFGGFGERNFVSRRLICGGDKAIRRQDSVGGSHSTLKKASEDLGIELGSLGIAWLC